MEEFVKVGSCEIWQKQTTIDWEQRRYEIAKSVLNAILQLPSPRIAASDCNMSIMTYNVKLSVRYADALIEELKKK